MVELLILGALFLIIIVALFGVSVLLSLFQVVLGIAVLIGIVIGIIKFIDRKNPSSPKVTDDTAKTSTKAIEDWCGKEFPFQWLNSLIVISVTAILARVRLLFPIITENFNFLEIVFWSAWESGYNLLYWIKKGGFDLLFYSEKL